jgi:hypothetical protein
LLREDINERGGIARRGDAIPPHGEMLQGIAESGGRTIFRRRRPDQKR